MLGLGLSLALGAACSPERALPAAEGGGGAAGEGGAGGAIASGGAGGAEVRVRADGGSDVSLDVAGATLIEPDGRTIAVPPACQVSSESQPSPFQMMFTWRNDLSTAVYFAGCSPGIQISSCASGYLDQLLPTAPCPCLCDTACLCSISASCPSSSMPLEPGLGVEVNEVGYVYVNERQNGGQMCYEQFLLPAGRYRARLPFYATPQAAQAGTSPLGAATADFELPSAAPVALATSAI
jgi:hypothetical protein